MALSDIPFLSLSLLIGLRELTGLNHLLLIQWRTAAVHCWETVPRRRPRRRHRRRPVDRPASSACWRTTSAAGVSAAWDRRRRPATVPTSIPSVTTPPMIRPASRTPPSWTTPDSPTPKVCFVLVTFLEKKMSNGTQTSNCNLNQAGADQEFQSMIKVMQFDCGNGTNRLAIKKRIKQQKDESMCSFHEILDFGYPRCAERRQLAAERRGSCSGRLWPARWHESEFESLVAFLRFRRADARSGNDVRLQRCRSPPLWSVIETKRLSFSSNFQPPTVLTWCSPCSLTVSGKTNAGGILYDSEYDNYGASSLASTDDLYDDEEDVVAMAGSIGGGIRRVSQHITRSFGQSRDRRPSTTTTEDSDEIWFILPVFIQLTKRHSRHIKSAFKSSAYPVLLPPLWWAAESNYHLLLSLVLFSFLLSVRYFTALPAM